VGGASNKSKCRLSTFGPHFANVFLVPTVAPTVVASGLVTAAFPDEIARNLTLDFSNTHVEELGNMSNIRHLILSGMYMPLISFSAALLSCTFS
jgi:hypothetical protein